MAKASMFSFKMNRLLRDFPLSVMKVDEGCLMTKTKRVLSALSLVASLCVAINAKASEEKILILGDRMINPETGEEGHRLLNPKGVVDVAFTTSGLQITFETESGKIQSVRLFAEFPEITKEPTSEAEKMFLEMMSEGLKGGRVMAGHILRNTAQALASNKAVLKLSFETSRPGFVISDYSYKEAIVHLPGGTVSLEQAVMNAISSDANQKVSRVLKAQAEKEAKAEARAQQLPQDVAAVAPKNPIGFIWPSQPGSVPAVRVCEMMFKASGS